jgi:anti-sigma regulatory factor (Ser/Thr protein kinase)
MLDEWGLLRVGNEARLLTSELVTNAVVHARTELTLTVTRDTDRDVVRVSVADGSAAQPARRSYRTMSTGGRGLGIVAEGSQAFGVDSFEGGKAVWFELALGDGATG